MSNKTRKLEKAMLSKTLTNIFHLNTIWVWFVHNSVCLHVQELSHRDNTFLFQSLHQYTCTATRATRPYSSGIILQEFIVLLHRRSYGTLHGRRYRVRSKY